MLIWHEILQKHSSPGATEVAEWRHIHIILYACELNMSCFTSVSIPLLWCGVWIAYAYTNNHDIIMMRSNTNVLAETKSYALPTLLEFDVAPSEGCQQTICWPIFPCFHEYIKCSYASHIHRKSALHKIEIIFMYKYIHTDFWGTENREKS